MFPLSKSKQLEGSALSQSEAGLGSYRRVPHSVATLASSPASSAPHEERTMGLLDCRPSTKRKVLYICVMVSLVATFYAAFSDSCPKLSVAVGDESDSVNAQENVRYIYDENKRRIAYGDDAELIFVGGMPRSGTTLMRVMLDAHPEVRCGEETRVVPRILGLRTTIERSQLEKARLKEAGVTDEVLDSAVRAFILEVIAKHGKAAPRLCNKDPFTLRSSVYLSQQFPKSKFILMLRDGRAVVHSIITRNVSISGFNLQSYEDCLIKWNMAVSKMYSSCQRVGPTRCLPVYYEQLVLHPKVWLERILRFLDLPWSEAVLHHEDFIGRGGEISLSKVEKSTDQVIRPVYLDSLAAWVGKIPNKAVQKMDKLAPMLKVLGYDPWANPPNYTHPPDGVADNSLHTGANADFWRDQEPDTFDTRPEDDVEGEGQGQRSGVKDTRDDRTLLERDFEDWSVPRNVPRRRRPRKGAPLKNRGIEDR